VLTSGQSRKAFTHSSISLQSFDKLDLKVPIMPIAWTKLSTRRMLTPAIRPFWITDGRAFSAVFGSRGSRGNYARSRAWEPSR